MNRRYVISATTLWLIFCSLTTALVVSPAFAEDGYHLPQFRTVQQPLEAPEIESGGVLRLLADADFPPFSFTSQQGAPSGLAVELALAACGEAKIACEVQLMPFADLLPALAKRSGDAVIAGPRIDEASLATALPTRPWFRTMARFAVQSGSPLTDATARSLAGKRVGVIKGSLHALWLEANFPAVTVTPFDTETAAQDALRTGNVDALFGDNLHLIYWIAGGAGKGCCKLLDHSFSDFASFSRNISMLVRSDRPDLRAALDYGLDKLQVSGAAEKIFNRYIPLNPW